MFQDEEIWIKHPDLFIYFGGFLFFFRNLLINIAGYKTWLRFHCTVECDQFSRNDERGLCDRVVVAAFFTKFIKCIFFHIFFKSVLQNLSQKQIFAAITGLFLT